MRGEKNSLCRFNILSLNRFSLIHSQNKNKLKLRLCLLDWCIKKMMTSFVKNQGGGIFRLPHLHVLRQGTSFKIIIPVADFFFAVEISLSIITTSWRLIACLTFAYKTNAVTSAAVRPVWLFCIKLWIDWLIDWLVVWLIDWLIDWLIE